MIRFILLITLLFLLGGCAQDQKSFELFGDVKLWGEKSL